uniref:Immunoglobulin domain-containing protein n=1 Tax=Sinocyclocheilus rhinocerous TaxID=307959 RepID=A0A673N6P5_9TELE
VTQCTFALGISLHVSQPESAVRVQPGHSTALQCFTPDDGHFKVFWLKFQNSSAPDFVALAESDKTGIMIGEKFQDPSKFRLTWNQLSFNLSVLNIEQRDIAVYYCGMIIFNRMFFGNGTRLINMTLNGVLQLIKVVSVRVQPGHSTALQCVTPDDGHFKEFWLKLQNSSAPVLVALADSDKTGIMIGEKFQDPSKFRLTWNQLSFDLSVLNIEQTDIAVYYCGIIIYNRDVYQTHVLHFLVIILLLSNIALCIVTYYNMKCPAFFSPKTNTMNEHLKGSYDAFLKIIILCIWSNRIC